MPTIATTFTTRPAAEAAISELVASGFEMDQLSILMTENARGLHFRVMEGNKAAEGALGGGLAGGALGALIAGLVAVGVLAAPGIGLVAVGPVLAALAGAGAGTVSGGLVGGLVGLGIPEHEAKPISEKVTRGGILMAVEARSVAEEQLARRILQPHTEARISSVSA